MKKAECDYNKITGIIIHGDAFGQTIGFPTANVKTNDPLPENGVYIATMEWNSKQYNGILNIGTRPTIHGKDLRIEIHLLDFNKNLYGETVSIKPLLFLRKEKKFEKTEELQQQINADKAIAIKYFLNQ